MLFGAPTTPPPFAVVAGGVEGCDVGRAGNSTNEVVLLFVLLEGRSSGNPRALCLSLCNSV